MAQVATKTTAPVTVTTVVSAAPALLLAGFHGFHRFREIRQGQAMIGAAATVIAIMGLIVTTAAALSGQSWEHGIIALALTLAVAVARPSRREEVLLGIVASVVTMIASAAVYAVLVPNGFRAVCGRKCEMLGGFVSIGLEGGSNAFGITLAMLSGIVIYRLTKIRGALAGAALVLVCLATGARLATAATAIVVVLAWLAANTTFGRRILPYSVAALSTVSIVTAAVLFPDESFTRRAMLWDRARAMIEQRPFFGHGISHWVRDASTQPEPTNSYAPHNIWLDLLVSIGFIGTLTLVAAIGLGVWLAQSDSQVTIWLLLAGIIGIGAFESTVMPFRFGPMPSGFLLLLLLLTVTQRKEINELKDSFRTVIFNQQNPDRTHLSDFT